MNKQWYWLAGFIIIGVLLGVGVLFLVTRPPRGSPIILLPAPSPAPITVYISGRVNKAGVYALPSGSRVNDAIQAAGGFSEHANSGALNLAKILGDGEQIDVPELITGTLAGGNAKSTDLSFIMVDINTATLEQLDALPEIGPKTAQEIINYRNTNGPFAVIEDIMNVPRIGQATFDKIKSLITVGTSP
jgi:competence protein ComEA